MMTSSEEIPDKQIRAISEMGKPGQELSKPSSKVPCCTQTLLLALDHAAPSVAGSREQSH